MKKLIICLVLCVAGAFSQDARNCQVPKSELHETACKEIQVLKTELPSDPKGDAWKFWLNFKPDESILKVWRAMALGGLKPQEIAEDTEELEDIFRTAKDRKRAFLKTETAKHLRGISSIVATEGPPKNPQALLWLNGNKKYLFRPYCALEENDPDTNVENLLFNNIPAPGVKPVARPQPQRKL